MDSVENAAAEAVAIGEFEAAEAILAAALVDAPDSLPLRVKLAECLSKQLRFGEAIRHWRHILDMPSASIGDQVSAGYGLAICAAQSGEPHLVRPYLGRFDLRGTPFPSDWCWRPRILEAAGFIDEAEAELRALLAERPGEPFISLLLGAAMLKRGDPGGHHHLMAMSSRAFHRTYLADTPLVERIWEGEPLDGRSIAIFPHGGFGDTFQFIRHVPHLRRLGAARIVAVANPRCHGLILSAGVDAVVGPDEAEATRRHSDFWVGTYGLARVGEGSTGAYLTAPPSERVDAMLHGIRARAAGRPCIGLYWHSDMHHGEAKSIPLPALAPLFARRDVHWVILQRGFGLRRMREAGLGDDATVMGEELPFDETGALIAGLDGVATICAWPYHLSGALGTRTWLLAGRVMDGRHLNRERDSVLYPACASLVRQPAAGDWPGAIALLMKELDSFSGPPGEAAPPAPTPY